VAAEGHCSTVPTFASLAAGRFFSSPQEKERGPYVSPLRQDGQPANGSSPPPEISLLIDASARTDVGRVRKNNEDAFRIAPDLDLYVLSDGMGGQAHGEVASAMAIETIVEHCRAARNDPDMTLYGSSRPDLCQRSNRLMSAVRMANRKIFDAATRNPAQEGMGATIVAAWLDDRRMSLVHVGDSRAYVLRGGSLEQLTADHSLVAEHVRRGTMTHQEAATSQLQNVLIRALGTQEQVEVDVDEQMLLEGDTVLLCSDGLTHMVSDPEIASVLSTTEPAQAAADRLVDLANANGGQDNVTVIVIRALPEAVGLVARLRGHPTVAVKPGGKPDGSAGGKPERNSGGKPDQT
jgi:serine/threonine protein phosphatase PrpC